MSMNSHVSGNHQETQRKFHSGRRGLGLLERLIASSAGAREAKRHFESARSRAAADIDGTPHLKFQARVARSQS